jgi:hypothetical protein
MKNRGLRRQQTQRIINARVSLKKAVNIFDEEIPTPGYYANRHPFDCGNAGCLLCHWEKRYTKPRIKNWFNLIEGD